MEIANGSKLDPVNSLSKICRFLRLYTVVVKHVFDHVRFMDMESNGRKNMKITPA